MSAAITAIAIATAATLYTAEEQRKAQSNADERIKQDKIAFAGEQAWQQKKKGINDKNASMAALRVRGNPGTATMSGTAMASPTTGMPLASGGLGGAGPLNADQSQQAARAFTNSPLGL